MYMHMYLSTSHDLSWDQTIKDRVLSIVFTEMPAGEKTIRMNASKIVLCKFGIGISSMLTTPSAQALDQPAS